MSFLSELEAMRSSSSVSGEKIMCQLCAELTLLMKGNVQAAAVMRRVRTK